MTSSMIGEPHKIQAYSRFPQNSEFRLFMPSNSDDLSHDEALSSRIAALNLLDLSLENLGVEIDPSAADEMQDVIKACGDSKSSQDSDAACLFSLLYRVALTQLDSPTYRKPADKSALLTKAHKVIVGKYPHRHFNAEV